MLKQVSVIKTEGYWCAVFGCRREIYFHGMTPLEIDCPGADASIYSAFIPTNCKLYVPEKAIDTYMDWYKSWNAFDFLELCAF